MSYAILNGSAAFISSSVSRKVPSSRQFFLNMFTGGPRNISFLCADFFDALAPSSEVVSCEDAAVDLSFAIEQA